MYCPHCGQEVGAQAEVCLSCGKELIKLPRPEGRVSAGWWWLGFLIPIAGLFVWMFCQENEPVKARKAGIGAIVGAIVGVVFTVAVYVLSFLIPFLFLLAY